MEKGSFNVPKLAIFVLLIGTIVPIFGESQLVIEELAVEKPKMVIEHEKVSVVPELMVVNNIMTSQTDKCAQKGEICNRFGTGKPVCCKGLTCTRFRPWGTCVEKRMLKA